MKEIKFNGPVADAAYLAKLNIFFPVLFSLEVFVQRWAEDKLGSQSVLQKCVDLYRQMFEGGLTGNRIQIAARKTARQDLDDRIRRILAYVGVMAEQGDIEALVHSGTVIIPSKKRNRKSSKPSPTN